MKLVLDGHSFGYEMENILRLFLRPGADIEKGEETEKGDMALSRICSLDGGLVLEAAVRLGDIRVSRKKSLPLDASGGERERALAVLLFECLRQATGIRPAWGILTGIRPVKFCRSLMDTGLSQDQVRQTLLDDYLVMPGKIDLALSTAQSEQSILGRRREDGVSLYVSIPFCPSRCDYCSFVSHSIEKTFKLMPEYLRLLREEITVLGKIISELGLTLQTVYVGGGTPTVLEEEQLEGLLHSIGDTFDLSGLLEYTVEAGRPDTITAGKLSAMKKAGVDRISINPQTFNEDVLLEIGRRHTAEEAEQAYYLARQTGFRCVNMDLIAGLPTDTLECFQRSLKKAVFLAPENITVHALTIKRSARLREESFTGNRQVAEMIGYSNSFLTEEGYSPYYLYRQKGTAENMENVGYSKDGYEGYYNVYIMDETHTILSAGAGAVTKLWRPGRLERVYNHKFPYEYIGRFTQIIDRKRRINDFYEADHSKKIFSQRDHPHQ